MKILYLSYDGMTDQLGQSQVLPYLIGLSKKGHTFHLVSFEKKERFAKFKSEIESLIQSTNITWQPLVYHKSPPVLSTVYDIQYLKSYINKIHSKEKFDAVHCRSYITAIAGLWLKNKTGIKLIFDMRGFYADERVDGNIWKLSNPIFKIVFSYFKKKENELLNKADQIITLTHAAENIIQSWKLKEIKLPITVIPCCADLDLFDYTKVSIASNIEIKKQLGISEKQFILGYLGAIGTWYMLDEMLDFFKRLLLKTPDSIFLFITNENPEFIFEHCRSKNISNTNIRVIASTRKMVPSYLNVFDVSIFFITPAFSKKASSPTKQGELMGMGIPVICNSGVGDTDDIVNKYASGIVTQSFSNEDYDKSINQISRLLEINKSTIRGGAEDYFSLEKGINKYNEVYSALNQ